MGSITSILNMVALQAGPKSSSSANAADSSQSGSSVFGAAVNISLQVGTLTEAATGKVVDEWVYGASVTATAYQATAGSSVETGFESYLKEMNIPLVENGKEVIPDFSKDVGGSGSGSTSEQMNNILSYMENNIQTAINDQPQWQQWKAEDLLMGTVTDFSSKKS
jgi:hypothetical protein